MEDCTIVLSDDDKTLFIHTNNENLAKTNRVIVEAIVEDGVLYKVFYAD